MDQNINISQNTSQKRKNKTNTIVKIDPIGLFVESILKHLIYLIYSDDDKKKIETLTISNQLFYYFSSFWNDLGFQDEQLFHDKAHNHIQSVLKDRKDGKHFKLRVKLQRIQII